MRQRRLRFWDRSFRGRSVYPALRGKQSALRIFSGHFPFCGAGLPFPSVPARKALLSLIHI